jgi:hypothetical protein
VPCLLRHVMMAKINSRSKGARAERKLAKLFAVWWGADFARTPLSGGFSTKQFREDWNAAGDLVTPDPSFPFCVESKHVEGWHIEQLLTAPRSDIYRWWFQTTQETPEGHLPLLVFTRNRQPYFFIMKRDHLVSSFTGLTIDVILNNKDSCVIGLLSDLFLTERSAWTKHSDANNV